MSQTTLAKKCHISPVYLSKIERGISTGRIETLVAITNALEISIEDILIDSLQVTNTKKYDDLSYLLLECSDEEAGFIIKAVENIRDMLKDYDLKKKKKMAKVDNDMT